MLAKLECPSRLVCVLRMDDLNGEREAEGESNEKGAHGCAYVVGGWDGGLCRWVHEGREMFREGKNKVGQDRRRLQGFKRQGSGSEESYKEIAPVTLQKRHRAQSEKPRSAVQLPGGEISCVDF